MLITRRTLWAIALSVGMAHVHPVNAVDNTDTTWKGEGELGFLRSSGNTDTQSLTAKLGLGREQVQWRHNGKLEAMTKSDSGTTTAERYFVAAKSDYKFHELTYAYAAADYEEDHFSGYERRMNQSIGLGRRLINQPALTLDLEVGPGARQNKRDDGTSENEATVRLGGNLTWKITPNATFTEEFSSTFGETNTTSRSVTALLTKISEAYAMKLSYLYKTTSEVPEGFSRSDAETAATLVYSF